MDANGAGPVCFSNIGDYGQQWTYDNDDDEKTISWHVMSVHRFHQYQEDQLALQNPRPRCGLNR